ncbi:MAG: hypothetical protein J5725_00425 [Bacteroidales bacterium]|nr:hypothetical protein [Bacteroidales bacterium]
MRILFVMIVLEQVEQYGNMNGLIELGIINKDGYERDNRVYFRGADTCGTSRK